MSKTDAAQPTAKELGEKFRSEMIDNLKRNTPEADAGRMGLEHVCKPSCHNPCLLDNENPYRRAALPEGVEPPSDLIKKVVELTDKVTRKEKINSELWLLGCEIYDDICAEFDIDQIRLALKAGRERTSAVAPGTTQKDALVKINTIARIMVYRCGHPRGGCKNHCDPLVRIVELSERAAAPAEVTKK